MARTDGTGARRVLQLRSIIPRDDGTTRLIARFRTDYNPKFANAMMYGPPLVEPISCVMQRKMLLGIKQRVEMAVRSSQG